MPTKELTEVFGRPSISPNTSLNRSVIIELLELHGEFNRAARNFAESRRVRDAARAHKDLDDEIANLRYTLDKLSEHIINIDEAFIELSSGSLKEAELTDKQKKIDLNKNNKIDGQDLARLRARKKNLDEADRTAEVKRYVQRNYKKGDSITYVDARDHQTYTHTYKGMKNRGGRPYAAVETGRELLMVPMYQLVVDI